MAKLSIASGNPDLTLDGVDVHAWLTRMDRAEASAARKDARRRAAEPRYSMRGPDGTLLSAGQQVHEPTRVEGRKVVA
jgi:hypothetical protein